MSDGIPQRFGLIAGEGSAPLIVAKEAREQGIEVIAFAFNKITSQKIEQYASKVVWTDFGHFEKLLELFKQNNLKHLIMIGRINHKLVLKLSLFDRWSRTILKSLASKDPKAIKNTIFNLFEKENITCLNSSLFLKECMPKPGLLTPECPLNEREKKNIEYGFPIARQLAKLEIGQTIAVKDGIVIAVEGIEGTNNLIERAGQLAGEGCTIIKASRPKQDPRFDIPVVGLTTLEKMHKAKCTALALTAGETVLLDQNDVIEFALKHNISIVSIDPKDFSL